MTIIIITMAIFFSAGPSARHQANVILPPRVAGTLAMIDGVEYVWIPPGQFLMGAPPDQPGSDADELPQHTVIFTRGFWLSRFEITNAQFCRFLNDQGNQVAEGMAWLEIDDEDCRIQKSERRFEPLPGFAQHPVTQVSWWGAQAFAAWSGARLPSEAEWEYACRAGQKANFITGECADLEQVNFNGKSTLEACPSGTGRGATLEVGSFTSNTWGLYDMLGNVWEWCTDSWHGSYIGAPADGGAWTINGDDKIRVVRGGSWFSSLKTLRSAYRHFTLPEYRSRYTGIRLAKTALE